MKIKIEIDEELNEEEVVIRTPALNQKVQYIQETLSEMCKQKQRIVFYKGDVEYFLPIQRILFF